MWDVVRRCSRQGSLDSAIKDAEPNDIPRFLRDHPACRRLVFAATSATFFKRLFAGWLKDGPEDAPALVTVRAPGDEAGAAVAALTAKMFGRCKAVRLREGPPGPGEVELVVLPSTSPAAATVRPPRKELLWHRGAFGLRKPPAAYVCAACGAVAAHHLATCPRLTEWLAANRARRPRGGGGSSWYF